ncbi:MAG: hypothetical protein IKJ47_00040 [Oscillospiraceae bacterium]|nr:hypothetical protein [Oscillospiraceae bacterium]
MKCGLKDYEVERIIRHSLNKNPDLKYYINNDYIEEVINLLVIGVSKAIEENNKKIISDIERQLHMKA